MSVPGATFDLSELRATQRFHVKRTPPAENRNMTDKLTFVLPGTPTPKGRARSTKTGRHYTPAKTKQAEHALLGAYLLVASKRQPHDGPVSIELLFSFTPPPSWPKWKRDLALVGNWPHTIKPDVDNLTKLIDGLNGRAWVDDSQIANVQAIKCYGARAATHVLITFHPAPTKPTTR